MLYPYRKSKQIERYIGQFMRVFAGFQVPIASNLSTLKRVPVVYGTMDRVVASLLNNRETFTNHRLPIMSANMRGLTSDPRRKQPNVHVDELNLGDKVYERLTGIPYILEMELAIHADSTTQLLEIVEQILLIFHPRVAIQIDTHIASNEYISEITLDSIQPEIQYPLGQNQRVVQMILNFTIPVLLRYPVGENSDIINKIKLQVMAESEKQIPTIEQYIEELEETP